MRWIAFVVALLGSILTGLVSIRTDEVQPAVLVIAVICMGLGFAVPRLAWLWAIIVGLGVIAGYAFAGLTGIHVKAPPEPHLWATLIALIPAFLFAYLGAGARLISGTNPAPSHEA